MNISTFVESVQTLAIMTSGWELLIVGGVALLLMPLVLAILFSSDLFCIPLAPLVVHFEDALCNMLVPAIVAQEVAAIFALVYCHVHAVYTFLRHATLLLCGLLSFACWTLIFTAVVAVVIDSVAEVR